MDDWRIEPLAPSHEREEFCCGKASLDNFLRSLAGQYEKRSIGRTYVAVLAGGKRVCGYYTLAASAIPFQNLPAPIAKKLPRHPIPVVLLGRLAVDQSVQGRGLGEHLLFDALWKCLDLSNQLGIFAVEIIALDSQAGEFYQKYGFVPLPDNDLHLYLPIKSIAEGLAK